MQWLKWAGAARSDLLEARRHPAGTRRGPPRPRPTSSSGYASKRRKTVTAF